RDEVSYLKEAREEGREEGEKIGEQRGREEGRKEANRVTARNLLKMVMLTDEQVAEATGLSLSEIKALRDEASCLGEASKEGYRDAEQHAVESQVPGCAT
ncbi:MAG: hypothetical protein ACLFSG_00855, partial [Halothiobacillaceae bacterium]